MSAPTIREAAGLKPQQSVTLILIIIGCVVVIVLGFSLITSIIHSMFERIADGIGEMGEAVENIINKIER